MKSGSISKKPTTYEGTCWIFTSSGRRYGGKILGGPCHVAEELKVQNMRPCIRGVSEFLFIHCGPLIKREKRPFLTKLAIATVSPISLAIPMS